MIQCLADENCDSVIVKTLRQLGYDVSYIAEYASGATDKTILGWGLEESRIILTQDSDFSELIFRDRLPSYGVVLIRVTSEYRSQKAPRVKELIENHANELVGAITTITLNNIRIRPLPS